MVGDVTPLEPEDSPTSFIDINLNCCQSKQFTKTRNHYTLFIKINVSFVKKKVICDFSEHTKQNILNCPCFFLLFMHLPPSLAHTIASILCVYFLHIQSAHLQYLQCLVASFKPMSIL
jgi:predicted type IV restriction endonuclease